MSAFLLPAPISARPSLHSPLIPRRKPLHLHPFPSRLPRACATTSDAVIAPAPPPPPQPFRLPALPPIVRLLAETALQLTVASLAVFAAVVAKTKVVAFAAAFCCLPSVALSVHRFIVDRRRRDVASDGVVEARTEREEVMNVTILRAMLAEEMDSVRNAMQHMENRMLKRENNRNVHVAETIAALDSSMQSLRRAMRERNEREEEVSFGAVAELEVAKVRLRDAQREKVEMDVKLQRAELSLEESKKQMKRVRMDMDVMVEREVRMQEEIGRLEVRAGRVEEMMERIEDVERRNDELRERLNRGVRENEELSLTAREAERKVSRVEEVSAMLRDKLRDVVGMGERRGKEDVEAEEKFWERRLRKRGGFGSGSLLYQELLGKDRKEWPVNPLNGGEGKSQVESLPPDGGFGTFGSLEGGNGENGGKILEKGEERKMIGGGAKVFSFSRDEFDNTREDGKGKMKELDGESMGNTSEGEIKEGVHVKDPTAAPKASMDPRSHAKTEVPEAPSGSAESFSSPPGSAHGHSESEAEIATGVSTSSRTGVRLEGFSNIEGKVEQLVRQDGMQPRESETSTEFVPGDDKRGVDQDSTEISSDESDLNENMSISTDSVVEPGRDGNEVASAPFHKQGIGSASKLDEKTDEQSTGDMIEPEQNELIQSQTSPAEQSFGAEEKHSESMASHASIRDPTAVSAASEATKESTSTHGDQSDALHEQGAGQNQDAHVHDEQGISVAVSPSSDEESKESPLAKEQESLSSHESMSSSDEKDESVSSAEEQETPSPQEEKDPAVMAMDLVNSASELVKKGRRRGLTVAHAGVLFKKAVSRLEEALNYAPDRQTVEIQLGNALLSWAKIDLADPLADERLRRALDVFSSNLDMAGDDADESTIFNTGLCLCLLASTCQDGKAKEYYERACKMYDRLLERNSESRIGLFNCGLAYISLGRLTIAEEGSDASECMRYFETAAERFRGSLALKPDDVKGRAYLQDCERQMAELSGE